MNTFQETPANNNSISHRSLIYGVGINDAPYLVQPKVNGKQMLCPYYKVWKNMLKRCYDLNFLQNNRTYFGCIVCDGWLLFSNFKNWMMLQDWQDNELDKDLLIPGNRLYSPDTCIFIPHSLNGLLNKREAAKGEFARGVYTRAKPNIYYARCRVNSKIIRLGKFNTELAASQCYIQFKKDTIIAIANKQTNLKLKQGLIAHANLL